MPYFPVGKTLPKVPIAATKSNCSTLSVANDVTLDELIDALAQLALIDEPAFDAYEALID